MNTQLSLNSNRRPITNYFNYSHGVRYTRRSRVTSFLVLFIMGYLIKTQSSILDNWVSVYLRKKSSLECWTLCDPGIYEFISGFVETLMIDEGLIIQGMLMCDIYNQHEGRSAQGKNEKPMAQAKAQNNKQLQAEQASTNAHKKDNKNKRGKNQKVTMSQNNDGNIFKKPCLLVSLRIRVFSHWEIDSSHY